jgi:hypothetical protein
MATVRLAIDFGDDRNTVAHMRLVMRHEVVNGVTYEVWESPDIRMPEEMIGGLIQFLANYARDPGTPGLGDYHADIPASLLIRIMGEPWWRKFLEYRERSAARSLQHDTAAVIDLDSGDWETQAPAETK